MDYVNFNTKTTYSLMQSMLEPTELFQKAKEFGYSAIGVNDIGTLGAVSDALKYSQKANVKLIIGEEFNFTDDLSQESNERLRRISFFARNEQGYRNLLKLNKLANDHNILAFKKTISRLDWNIIEKHSEGLICLTGGGNGILGHLINTRRKDQAKLEVIRLQSIFKEFLYLEIQPHASKNTTPNAYRDYEDQSFLNNLMFKWGKELNIKLLPTLQAMYYSKDQHEAHDVMLAISCGQPVKYSSRPKLQNEFYFRTGQEVYDYFARLYPDQIETAIKNTVDLANLCEEPKWISPKFNNPSGKELPTFPVKDQEDYQAFLEDNKDKVGQEDVLYLRWKCEKTLYKLIPVEKQQQYLDRLNVELEVLCGKGFSSYMLIVADYIEWARNNNIPIGPGRGSCAGCLAAYFLNIHQIDSIKYGLIFERFQNKEKIAEPDIDCDFSQEGKPLVQEYIKKKYGIDYVAQISNYSRLKPKPYVKAISRVFQFGGDVKSAVVIGNSIAESVPKDAESITEALKKSPLFSEWANSIKYNQLFKYHKELENKYLNFSVHAGAALVSKRPLVSIIPLRRDKDDNLVVEYDKEKAEDNGLIKMDILGVSTLDIIQNTLDLIKESNKPYPIDFDNYDLNDQKTYDLISRGDTFCVFQFGTSSGTVDLCRKMKPKCIEDLAAINALTRPGVPKEFREKFLTAKASNTQVELLHPSLKRSLEPTYGIAIYDECLLTLGADVAGWDLNKSDRLRKFVKDKGKHPEKDEQLKIDFIASTINNGIQSKMAKKLWDELFQNFSSYLFNKSHAISYSFLAYQTAYLKAHYPLEFMVANLRFESQAKSLDSKDNVAKCKDEIRKLKVKLIPPDINTSDSTYKIISENTVMTSLDSLKFIGKDAIPEILAKRPFTSFEDFLSKVDGKKVRAPSIQALASSGCLDNFKMPRKQIFLYTQDYKKKFAVWSKRNPDKTFPYPWPEDVSEWTIPEKFAMESFYLGEGLENNFFQIFPGVFNNKVFDLSSLAERYPDGSASGNLLIQCVIKSIFEFKVKKAESKIFGEVMAKMDIVDPFGNVVPVTFFPKKLAHFKKRLKELGKVELKPGIALHLLGEANWYDGAFGIMFNDLAKAVAAPPKPKDLNPRKVTMKLGKGTRKSKIAEEILEDIEDELIEEGMADSSSDENEDYLEDPEWLQFESQQEFKFDD